MKFSVIVANYNNTKYLAELIKSVENQRYSNWELVIADDFSTDQVEDFIKPYLTNPKIKFIRHNQNKGAGATFKTAMDHSTGEIIGMLGADDALSEDALECMAKAHEEHKDASFIYSLCYECDQDLNKIRIANQIRQTNSKGTLMIEFCASNFATYKREFYYKTSGFNPKLKRSVDYDLFFKLEEVGSLLFVPSVLYYHRKHEGGISQFGNAIKAHLYQIKCMLESYQRRRKMSIEIFNLSKDRMLHYLRFYFLSKAIFNLKRNKLKSMCFILKLLVYLPSDILKKDTWKIILSAFGLNSSLPDLKRLH